MTNLYCGNNKENIHLKSNKLSLGNRYSCLKKGIGLGLNLPIDINYTGKYVPIDTTSVYCGKSLLLPNEYDRFGNLSECLQKGVGIGKFKKASQFNNNNINNNNINNKYNQFFHVKTIFIFTFIFILIISLIVGIIIFFIWFFNWRKDKENKDTNKDKKKDKNKDKDTYKNKIK